jgi:hypothetical protein
VVRQTVSCRRYPTWGWPGLLVFRQGGVSVSPRELVAYGSEKEAAGEGKNLTQFGHPRKTTCRASLRSDNCPTIPDQCPTISDWVSEFAGIRSVVRNR